MLNRMKRVAAGLLTAVFLFNIAPVSGVNNVAQVEAAKLVTKGKVNSSILNIRTRKSTKAKKITTLKRGAKVTLLSNNSKWVAVKVKGKVGYTQGKYITIANGATASATTMSKGQSVVNYAKRFLGNPYRWGGTSLTSGADCSGFTQSVLANFGISISRTAASQSGGGTAVDMSNLQPGDLLFYDNGSGIGHVSMYIGNGQVVHASNEQTGIIVSSVDYRTACAARSYF